MKASDAGQSPERLLLAAALYGDYGDQISEDEALGGYNLRETVRGLLALQDTRRATVLRLFFGLDGEPHTSRQIGQQLGVSTARINELRRSALRIFCRQLRKAHSGSWR